MSRRSVLSAALAMVPAMAVAQQALNINAQAGCSFNPNAITPQGLFSFEASPDALAIVQKITNTAGLAPNFKVLQANVPNATAVISGTERYILYSQVFMDDIIRATATEWASRTLLAHEIAHHLNGDTLTDTGSRPPLELKADYFAGHAINKLGGTLDQAKAVFLTLPEQGTDTHPPKSARLEAVSRGWNDAAPAPASQTAAVTGIEGKMRELVEAMKAGTPPFDKMSDTLVQALQSDWDANQAKLRGLGAIITVTKQGQHVAADGNTYYLFRIAFQNRSMSWQLGMNADGNKIEALHFQ